jgi:hypothetical protein
VGPRRPAGGYTGGEPAIGPVRNGLENGLRTVGPGSLRALGGVLVASAGARPGARAGVATAARPQRPGGGSRLDSPGRRRPRATRRARRSGEPAGAAARPRRGPGPPAAPTRRPRPRAAPAVPTHAPRPTRGPRCGRAIYKLNRQYSLATVNVSGYTRNTLSGVDNSSTSFRSFVTITCRARGCLAAVQDSLLISALRCIIMCESGR